MDLRGVRSAPASRGLPAPRRRGPGSQIRVYRFWRDLGYALGAVLAGLLSQAAGLSAAVIAGEALTFASSLLTARWITGTRGD
jgi:predicted MFS family arabinose efflux permease